MSVRDQSLAAAVGKIFEEDVDVVVGSPVCLSKLDLSRAKRVVERSMAKSRRVLFRRSGERLSKDKKDEVAVGVGNQCRRRCLFCFRKPKTLGSPDELFARDPNHPDFTYKMLRDLLQRNEFPAECSTSLDAVESMCDHGK